jgi:aminodeoxyfutalosine deaminase
MNYKKISANKIHTISGPVLENHALILRSDGHIIDIVDRESIDPGDLQVLEGELIPGFVNAHCHLELSHMKNLIPTGTGLIDFIRSVVQYRDFPEEVIQEAMEVADQQMYEHGIVAVGDISNKTDSISVKQNSQLAYATFVEFFDLMSPSRTQDTFSQYREVWHSFPEDSRLRKSAVPHAPYSVTPGLFDLLKSLHRPEDTISIHNQETPGEIDMFLHSKGPFYDFYEGIGSSLEHFDASGQSSIAYAMRHMPPENRTLFVHNTLTSRTDIQTAKAWNDRVFWATCPNANLYIENRLPDYRLFLEEGAKVCIGTDSLTSNWQLSIWEEIRSILRYQSYIPFETVLKWATLHGAEALGMEHTLGSIEVGKKPGLLLLSLNMQGKADQHSTYRRVV